MPFFVAFFVYSDFTKKQIAPENGGGRGVGIHIPQCLSDKSKSSKGLRVNTEKFSKIEHHHRPWRFERHTAAN